MIHQTTQAVSLAFLVLVLASPRADGADEYRVSDLKWSNNGAYAAVVGVRWKSARTGETHKTSDTCYPPHWAPPGYSHTIPTGQHASCRLQDVIEKGLSLEPGDEVWLHINILKGDNKSCHKDDIRLIFDPEAKRKGTFSSGGTTLNNNRCKWRGVEDL